MNDENEGGSRPRNGEYFMAEMNKEKCRLETLVEKATEILNKLDSSSDEAGRTRAAIGKANLLCSKKFKQFQELCDTNLEQTRKGILNEPFTTKDDDLAGFWDVVLIQVGQIHSMFEDLDPNHFPKPKSERVSSGPLVSPRFPLARRSDPLKTSPATAPRNKPSKPKSESASASLRDESRRKLLAEKRRAMKKQVDGGGSPSEADVQIFVPRSN